MKRKMQKHATAKKSHAAPHRTQVRSIRKIRGSDEGDLEIIVVGGAVKQ